MENFLAATHRDDHKGEDLKLENLYKFPEPEVEFDMKEPTFQEVQSFIKKARTKSAPGPNGIPYKVYKYCPEIMKVMWRILKNIWKDNVVPDSWKKAEGCFLPKVDNARQVKEFRTVSFLNVEGKVYKGLLAKKLTKFAMSNGYIDQSIQKAGIPGVSGCLENSAILTQMISEAKKNKRI